MSDLKEKDPKRIEADVIGTLKTCYDPEIPVDIYELGLIYGVKVSHDAHVDIQMTLTSPMCPVAESLPPEVEARVRALPDVAEARVEVTWEPPWSPEMMSEAARLELEVTQAQRSEQAHKLDEVVAREGEMAQMEEIVGQTIGSIEADRQKALLLLRNFDPTLACELEREFADV